MYHTPVLLAEALEGLQLRPEGHYVDATFGGGGHSRAIMAGLGQGEGRLYAFDQDPDAAKNRLYDTRFHFFPCNFRQLYTCLADYPPVDGILADLGVSSHQLDEPGRGFSYRAEAPLDMRMQQQGPTAAELIALSTPEALADILYQYGDFRKSRPMARAIKAAQPETTTQLVAAVRSFLPRHNEYADLSRLFQALRIAVNDEMAALEDLLQQSLRVLKPGGRLVIISYHSYEDRLVKHYLRAGRADGELQKDAYGHPHTPWRLITRRAITPDEAEIRQNPRARSAKLRIAEKA
ncbi:MAG: 16S rRNA (cytosine(1402)-N(4))-methyltransferase RsmH [Bacteroidetes bacterium]|nr:16S rRNA (cytosine(1402)-N(4))-methyltransferase RsmH [Bacteroidota bacterium]